MSNVTQQEIASAYGCDTTTANAKELNAILFHIALLASIIVFTTALTVFLSSVNAIAAAVTSICVFSAAYPVYKLIKLIAFSSLAAFFAGIILLGILTLLMFLIPASALNPTYTLAICVFVIIAVTVALLIVSNTKKFSGKIKELINQRVFNGLITILFFVSVAVLLSVFFRNSSSKGFGFQLWRKVQVMLPFTSMAFTYAGLAGFSIGVIMLICYLFMEKTTHITTKYITYVATFSALSVVFKIMGNAMTNTLGVFSSTFKFTLVYIPWVAAGIVTGPFGAIIATAIGDFLGQIMLPSASTWFWMTWLSNVLFPLFPALVYKYVRTKKNFDWLKVLVGMIISSVVCTLGLGTVALSVIWGQTYWAQLAQRPPQLIVIGINYALLVTILPTLRRAKSPLLYQPNQRTLATNNSPDKTQQT